MDKSPKTLVALSLGALMATTTLACKDPEIKAGNRATRTVEASISTFDPDADVVLDLDKYGSERPDDYAVQQAFAQAYEPMDVCVLAAKERKHMAAESVLHDGMMDISIKLDGPKGKAMAVNASLPGKLDKDSTLKDCIRDAVGGVQFPSYDGPPVVVDFHTEVDAGYMDE
ncbi:MAG: hypothetical protein H6712_34915 [Myxococcales bacterium]|nr:hypothetical protein [Myxococcales bacterium]